MGKYLSSINWGGTEHDMTVTQHTYTFTVSKKIVYGYNLDLMYFESDYIVDMLSVYLTSFE